MLEVVRWAAEQYQQCLLDSPLAEAARTLSRRAPADGRERSAVSGWASPRPDGDWLVEGRRRRRSRSTCSKQVGLLARRNEGDGYYDRFRDRVMFPIRDAARPDGGIRRADSAVFALAGRAPKYYNSSDTPLFSKSEHLYGLDQARQAAAKAGYLAVVEGYTDVLMAHQTASPRWWPRWAPP